MLGHQFRRWQAAHGPGRVSGMAGTWLRVRQEWRERTSSAQSMRCFALLRSEGSLRIATLPATRQAQAPVYLRNFGAPALRQYSLSEALRRGSSSAPAWGWDRRTRPGSLDRRLLVAQDPGVGLSTIAIKISFTRRSRGDEEGTCQPGGNRAGRSLACDVEALPPRPDHFSRVRLGCGQAGPPQFQAP